MVTVELVYDTECPNAEEARTNLRRALTEVGVATQWTEWEASSDATPAHLRCYGSPAVLVNGHDVAGGGPGAAASCRVFGGAGARATLPAPPVILPPPLAAGGQQGAHRSARG